MNDKINILGDEFISEVAQYIMEESEFSRIQQEYEEAKNKLEKSNKKRIEVIANIRTNKIQEINEELELTKKKLKDIREEIKNIFLKYCEKNDHNCTLINKRIVIDPQTFDYCNDHEYYMELKYKCKICGQVVKKRKYIQNLDEYTIQKYKKEIPYEIYDDKTLSEFGKNMREMEKEIEQLENNIDYLIFLKERICELFGHDAKRMRTNINDNDIFKCNCCGKKIGYREYINAHYNAKYRDIIPYYYNSSKETPIYIMREPNNTTKGDLFLPSYEDYQKKLVLKKENEDKN